MSLSAFIPSVSWLKNYSKDQLKGDLSAGLTVGVMLIPQGMAYAMIAGLPPIYGLYASTLPLIIYALLGTSRQLAVGPVAMVSLLTAAGIGVLAEGGTETYIMLAITLAFLVGVIQFLLGVFRLGFLVNFLSHPVISGFTSAAALIIGLSQLKHLLGVNLDRSHHVHEILIQAVEQIGAINWTTFGIGIAGIALIMGVKKINKSIPGPLLAVLFGILAVWGMGLVDHGVKIVGTVPEGLPSFGLPDFSLATIQSLLPIALAISLVSFMESIAVAKAIQAKHKNYKVVPNQELIALGLANVGGSFFQAYPVTGGFSRTAVNDQAGAKTGMASIISAILIITTLLFLTPLFYYLPKAILASVIMVAVFGLIDVKEAVHLWRADRSDFWMLVITFIATLSLGIEQGIGVGVILSLAMIIFETTRPHIAQLGKVPSTHFYRNRERFEQVEIRKDLLIVRFDAQLYFANLNVFRERIDEWMATKGPDLDALIINAESINTLDSSALHLLEDLLEDLKARNCKLLFTGVKGPVRDALVKGHLVEKIGADNFFMSVQEAVDAHDERKTTEGAGNEYQEFTLQTNV
ncbi:SulP family inorganic anion transporter [Lewinella cohaerens]|uniref:SulP family inorganic anion transporter n=1 Tax=Lewinella cohaerens TaxID=70995 RepID=UPI000379DB20|nr:solute carrier family 26 protein [Lewinella cohaerens]